LTLFDRNHLKTDMFSCDKNKILAELAEQMRENEREKQRQKEKEKEKEEQKTKKK